MFLLVTNKQSISALRLQRLHQHGSYHTSTRWLRELRRAMGVALEKEEPLGPIVEVDEIFIGGVDLGGKRGVGSEKRVPVVAAVEAIGGRCGRARFRVLGHRSTQEILSFGERFVAPGAVIKTDWTRQHLALNDGFFVDARIMTDTNDEIKENATQKKRKEKGAKSKVERHLPNVHRVTSLIKRVIISAHQGSVGRHLQSYLDEYCFRFDHRNRNQFFGVFQDLAIAAAKTTCVPYWRSCGRIAPDKPTYRQPKPFRASKGGVNG